MNYFYKYLSKYENILDIRMFAINKAPSNKSAQPQEVVTVGMYCLETEAQSFNIVDQIKLIEHIRNKISEAAREARKTPPKFILSMLLVPDWNRLNNNYTDRTYLKTKGIFFKNINTEINRLNSGFELSDAYKDVLPYEKNFLHHLKNKGANADWIKTHALIINQNMKHLQLDSNTQIYDYRSFYDNTFGQNEYDALNAGGHDGLNASAYDAASTYVSAHNKVIYTVPNGKIVKALANPFMEYCIDHGDPRDPDKGKNSIYSKVFCPSLAAIGLTIHKSIIDPLEGVKDRYLVAFDKPEYKLTRDIITAVNMSWSISSVPDPYAVVKKAPPLKYRDADITFQCYVNLVNVHTSSFSLHDNHDDIKRFRNVLHDKANDMKIIKAYYQYIEKNISDLLSDLINVIPQNEQGEHLCLEAFGYNVKELKQRNIKQKIKRIKDELDDFQTRPKIATIAEKSSLYQKLNEVTSQLAQPENLASNLNRSFVPLSHMHKSNSKKSYYVLPDNEQILAKNPAELRKHAEIIEKKIDAVGEAGPIGIELQTYKSRLHAIKGLLKIKESINPSEHPKYK